MKYIILVILFGAMCAGGSIRAEAKNSDMLNRCKKINNWSWIKEGRVVVATCHLSKKNNEQFTIKTKAAPNKTFSFSIYSQNNTRVYCKVNRNLTVHRNDIRKVSSTRVTHYLSDPRSKNSFDKILACTGNECKERACDW